MTQNTIKIQDSFKIAVRLPVTIFILCCYCMAIAFATPERNLNRAVEGVAGEIFEKLPKDSSSDSSESSPIDRGKLRTGRGWSRIDSPKRCRTKSKNSWPCVN